MLGYQGIPGKVYATLRLPGLRASAGQERGSGVLLPPLKKGAGWQNDIFKRQGRGAQIKFLKYLR